MINYAMAKLFYIPPIEEFKPGGILRLVLKTLLVSLLKNLPQMEKDFTGGEHQLTHKIWTSMLAAKFSAARVREISSLIAQDIFCIMPQQCSSRIVVVWKQMLTRLLCMDRAKF
jgi:hypothetical protein